MSKSTEAYRTAQHALAELKSAICQLLAAVGGETGLTNAMIGRMLGIYHGHVGHEGHIPRTLLGMMQAEGLVEQDPKSKRWRLCRYESGSDELAAEPN